MLTSILMTLLAVTASLGIASAADDVARKQAAKGELTPDKIIAMINSKLSQIQRRSADAYSKVLDKINNMPIVAEAGNLKAYLSKVRLDNENLKNLASSTMTNVETAVNDIKNRASVLANQTDSYRASKAGKEEYNNLISEAENLSNNFSKEVDKIEKTV